MKLLVKILTALSLCTQSLWAAQPTPLDLPTDTMAIVAKFKTQGDLIEYLKKWSPAKDAEAIDAFIKGRVNPADKALPVYIKKDTLTVEVRDQRANIKILDLEKSLFQIGGVEVDLSPIRPVKDRLEQTEELLKRQYSAQAEWNKFSILPEAHALPIFPIAYFAAFALFTVVAGTSSWDAKDRSRLLHATYYGLNALSLCHRLELKPKSAQTESWIQPIMDRRNHVLAEWCGGAATQALHNISLTQLTKGPSYAELCRTLKELKSCTDNMVKKNVSLTEIEVAEFKLQLSSIPADSATTFERYVPPSTQPAIR